MLVPYKGKKIELSSFRLRRAQRTGEDMARWEARTRYKARLELPERWSGRFGEVQKAMREASPTFPDDQINAMADVAYKAFKRAWPDCRQEMLNRIAADEEEAEYAREIPHDDDRGQRESEPQGYPEPRAPSHDDPLGPEDDPNWLTYR